MERSTYRTSFYFKMSAEKTTNKKLKGLSMYEVSKETCISYQTDLKWTKDGKIYHLIENRINKFIEENGTNL